MYSLLITKKVNLGKNDSSGIRGKLAKLILHATSIHLNTSPSVTLYNLKGRGSEAVEANLIMFQ